MKDKIGIALFKIFFFFLIAAALGSIVFAASANYGQGAYGSGVYGQADTSSSSEISGGSTTSSSGGGGAVAESQAKAATSSSQMWASANSGQTLTMNLKSEAIAIKQVETSVNKDLQEVEITVNKLLEPPTTVKAIESDVYQFFDIKTKNVKKDDIKTIAMRFEVSKSWIEANKISENDIVLSHYKDSAWEELPTAIIKDSLEGLGNSTLSDVVKYEATASSFSYFAISIKKDALTGAGAVLNESCKESWECTEWSSCENGNQNRTCSDKNLCGTIADKPAEIKDCSNLAESTLKDEKAKKDTISFGKLFLWILILVGIAGVGVGGYYIYQNYSEYALGSAKPAQTASRAVSQEHLARLDEYITRCLSRGFRLELIEKQLLSAGWPKEAIDRQILEIIKKGKG